MDLFEKIEEMGYSNSQQSLDEDSFLCEQRYISNTKKITQAVFHLRAMFLKIWTESVDLEQQRIDGIQNLYEEIVKSNQTIFGPEVLKQLAILRKNFHENELFSFKGLVTEKELECFVTLCYQQGIKVNMQKADITEIQ